MPRSVRSLRSSNRKVSSRKTGEEEECSTAYPVSSSFVPHEGGFGRAVHAAPSDAANLPVLQSEMLMETRILCVSDYFAVSEGTYDGRAVALKYLRVTDARLQREFAREMSVLALLSEHPNVVRSLGTVTLPAGDVRLVLERADYSLAGVLSDPEFELSWPLRIKLARDVADGLCHLFRNGILHCDIKSGNVLLFFGDRDEDAFAKVCDFGLCRFISDPVDVHAPAHSLGTLEWMAPELVRPSTDTPLSCPVSEKTEVYSFGVLLWELATLSVPFAGHDVVSVSRIVADEARRLSMLPLPSGTPPAYAQLVQQCWRRDPASRPTLASVAQQLAVLYEGVMSGSSGSADES